MAVTIIVTGIKEIDAALKAMPAELQDKTLQSTGITAARPLVERAKSLAPKGKTHNLENSIGAYRSSFKRVVSGQREIGAVSAGPRRGRYKGFAAHLIEYGTAPRFNYKRHGVALRPPAYRGKVKSNPFMKPAFEQTKGVVLGSYNTILAKRLVGVMKKKLGGVR